jgi:hypothetical protein
MRIYTILINEIMVFVKKSLFLSLTQQIFYPKIEIDYNKASCLLSTFSVKFGKQKPNMGGGRCVQAVVVDTIHWIRKGRKNSTTVQ